jgi:hypothetical protein
VKRDVRIYALIHRVCGLTEPGFLAFLKLASRELSQLREPHVSPLTEFIEELRSEAAPDA